MSHTGNEISFSIASMSFINQMKIKDILGRYKCFRPFYLFYVGFRARFRGHPDWSSIIVGKSKRRWISKLKSTKGEKGRILIATSVGGHLPSTTIESLLGVSLVLRGAEVEYLLCDSALPACMSCEYKWYKDVEKFVKHGPEKRRCKYCYEPAREMLDKLGFEVNAYSQYLDDEVVSKVDDVLQNINIDDVSAFNVDGISVGEHAMAGALRFFARGDLNDNPFAERLVKVYLRAALLTLHATRRLIAERNIEIVVLHHGIYVPQGIIAEVARNMGVRVVTWHPAYRSKCFIFSHDDTYHHTMMSEPVSEWESISWSNELEEKTVNYLKSRWVGGEDWISFLNVPEFDLAKIEESIGVNFSRPCIGLLTNVVWDAQLHYPANAFSNMLDWLKKTIEYFAERTDLQLLIRVHPAEINGALKSRQRVVDEINAWFPELPENVFVVPPDSPVSTYAAMRQCDSVLIYGTKTGVELTCFGIPVIVAGEAWIRGKGVTIDVSSVSEYIEVLNTLPLNKRMTESSIQRAKKYAFHFFFRRMIPFSFMSPQKNWPPYKIDIDVLDELEEGNCLGLDVVCDGILKGTSFVYPFENEIS